MVPKILLNAPLCHGRPATRRRFSIAWDTRLATDWGVRYRCWNVLEEEVNDEIKEEVEDEIEEEEVEVE